MTEVDMLHSQAHYVIKTSQEPVAVSTAKKQLKEHCQQAEPAEKSIHLVLSKKKSEGTISFGDLERKEVQEFPTTAKKEVKYQQWEPRHSPQKIYFTYHSPQKIHEQPEHHESIHTVHRPHQFSLEFLRKKAGLAATDSQRNYNIDSRIHTVSHSPGEDSSFYKDRIKNSYSTYQIGHRECDVCSRGTDEKPIIIENRVYERHSSPVKNHHPVNHLVSAPIVQSRYLGNDAGYHSRISSLSPCRFQNQGKACQLCSISRRSNIQRLKTLNIDSSYSRLSQEDQYNQMIEPESKVSLINDTPGKQSYQRYLTYDEAYQISLKKPVFAFGRNQHHVSMTNHLLNPEKKKIASSYINNKKEPRLCYSITKKDQELIKKKQEALHKQKLKTLTDSAQKKKFLTPNKTFQSQGIDPYAHRLKTYSEIHGFKAQQEGYSGYKPKEEKKDVDFGWVRHSFEAQAQQDSRLARSRSRQLYSNHKSIRSCLRLYELSNETRRWYHANRRGIEFQSDLIFSNDIVRRSMSDDAIAERLKGYVVEMIDPKYWLSLMVTEANEEFRVKSRMYRPY